MVVNDNAHILDKRGVHESIASRLAPTGVVCCVPPYLSPSVTRTAISIARTLIAATVVSGAGWEA